MNKKLMMLILFILGAMVVSGCAVSKEAMMSYNEAKDLFQKATLAGAKKCAPCQYGTAEAYLALAEHEVSEKSREDHSNHFAIAVKTVKEKSLEAIKLTPCEKPPAPPTPAPPTRPTPPTISPVPPAPPKPVAPPVLDSVYFDPNKTNINPIAAKVLDRTGTILKENSQLRVEIGGHTDAAGSQKANQKISEKRALSVKKYLQDKFNIPEYRMIIKGYGSMKPIADNKTKEGRSKNRRVEFRVIP